MKSVRYRFVVSITGEMLHFSSAVRMPTRYTVHVRRGAPAAPAEKPDHVEAKPDGLGYVREAMARGFLCARHQLHAVAAPDELLSKPAIGPDRGDHQVAQDPQEG